jgi:hypothetical protein
MLAMYSIWSRLLTITNPSLEAVLHITRQAKVSVKKGERWFCSEAEALKAGWRAPYWGRGKKLRLYSQSAQGSPKVPRG